MEIGCPAENVAHSILFTHMIDLKILFWIILVIVWIVSTYA